MWYILDVPGAARHWEDPLLKMKTLPPASFARAQLHPACSKAAAAGAPVTLQTWCRMLITIR
jgi:hypothetical protein